MNMNVLATTWAFSIQPLEFQGKQASYKARCCLRGDQQIEIMDYEPFRTYATAANSKALQTPFAYASSYNLYIEGGDMYNA